MKTLRSHRCGQINESHVGEIISVAGWAHRRRDHGGVIFIDLRDATGLLQVVVDPDAEEAFALADTVRNEHVLQVTAKVRTRPEGTRNPDGQPYHTCGAGGTTRDGEHDTTPVGE